MALNDQRIALVHPAAATINSQVPWELASQLLWLPDRARNMGIHIMAGRGSGKSRLMGRVIAWQDFMRGVPLLIFDPVGQTITNFLDKVVRLPRELQARLWPRIVYIDMSGQCGYVFPFPLYYRLGHESLYEISQRYLDVVRKIDPHLQTAPIEGWNSLWRIGTFTGMILSALGYQITEAESLVRNPIAWTGRLMLAKRLYPEVSPAVDFFEDWGSLKEETQARRSDAFLTKVGLFVVDPSMKAMFGSSVPGINWSQVVKNRQAVLLDFHQEHNIERRRFKMVWTFMTFLDFIRHRGPGRHRPVSVIMDELTAMFSASTLATDLFAADLDELINVTARNYMVWLTIAHQELFQLDKRAVKTLMGMGTQILGVTGDPEAALTLARQFFRFDPHWVRKYEPVYATSFGTPQVIDYHSVEYTPEEQAILKSYEFADQGRFHFLVRASLREGDIAGSLRPVTITNFDRGVYPNEDLTAQARQLLMEKRGRQVSEVLSDIDARLSPEYLSPTRIAPDSHADTINQLPQRPSDTIDDYDGEHSDLDNPSQFGEKKTALRSQTSRTE